jgi:hypothetical protein
MSSESPKTAQCPRCGSSVVTLCGQSVQHSPEERAGQPLKERELHTLAYQCECGLAFTHTQKHDGAAGEIMS